MFMIYDRSVKDVSALVRQVPPEALARPTPCTEWSLRQLLAHMVVQNDSFAAIVAGGEEPSNASEPPDAEVPGEWDRSAAALGRAFRDADLDAPVTLSSVGAVPARVAMRMIILDNVVHAWDVAESLGQAYRPDDELVSSGYEFAQEIAVLPAEMTGGFFAPPTTDAEGGGGQRPWPQTLRLLGRRVDDDGRWIGHAEVLEVLDPGADEVRRLIVTRAARGGEHSGEAFDDHALDVHEFLVSGVDLLGLRDGEWNLVAIGALHRIDDVHVELKSMHTVAPHRGTAIAGILLAELIREARARGYRRMSLETGTDAASSAVRRLYAKGGFEVCPPFGDHLESPDSVYMTRVLTTSGFGT